MNMEQLERLRDGIVDALDTAQVREALYRLGRLAGKFMEGLADEAELSKKRAVRGRTSGEPFPPAPCTYWKLNTPGRRRVYVVTGDQEKVLLKYRSVTGYVEELTLSIDQWLEGNPVFDADQRTLLNSIGQNDG